MLLINCEFLVLTQRKPGKVFYVESFFIAVLCTTFMWCNHTLFGIKHNFKFLWTWWSHDKKLIDLVWASQRGNAWLEIPMHRQDSAGEKFSHLDLPSSQLKHCNKCSKPQVKSYLVNLFLAVFAFTTAGLSILYQKVICNTVSWLSSLTPTLSSPIHFASDLLLIIPS